MHGKHDSQEFLNAKVKHLGEHLGELTFLAIFKISLV
jgi:hypothetical protein